MIKMEQEQEKQEILERMSNLGEAILRSARDELYIGMRFMDVALSSFEYIMDLSLPTFATDGQVISYNPKYLGGIYRSNRILVNRGYLHMVLHCIFRHWMKRGMDEKYWDLSCDIAVEHMIDGISHRCVRMGRSLLRRDTYSRLEKEKKVLHAERIYRLLIEWNLDEKTFDKLSAEFIRDDHKNWENKNKNQKPNIQLQNKWQEIGEQMETDMETFSKEAGKKTGEFLGQLQVKNKKKYDYREFLQKFAVMKEEIQVDVDTFDYGFYSYGLRLYGNMPLIEPQETKEMKKISEFAVVIDTSMSCQRGLIEKFLEQTYQALSDTKSFFKKMNLHILQCDERIHQDQKISSREDLEKYMKNFALYGGGGTDFRPAFSYIEELRNRGEFQDLKGVVYFTDGYGRYPSKMPDYKTAFVFLKEDFEDKDVPSWAIRLILAEEDIEEGRHDEY